MIEPLSAAAASAGKPKPIVLATRWCLYASDEGEAWRALHPWRGLRAPGRLEAIDPETLRRRADKLPRKEVLGRYSIVDTVEQIVAQYRPLIDDLRADIVTFQMSCVDQVALIELLGNEVIPRLKAISG